MTEYSSPEPDVVDAAWDRSIVNGFVALPLSWLNDRQWPAARPMPGDPLKGIYVVDGFHQMHCLVCHSHPPKSSSYFHRLLM